MRMPSGTAFLFQLVEVCQSRQNNLFIRLLDLTSQEHLVEYCIHLLSVSNPPVSLEPLHSTLPFSKRGLTNLVEIKHQIQLTHIPKEGIQDLDKEMYSLQIRQLVIVRIDACAEEEASIAAVHNFGHVAELDKVGLVFLVARGDEAMDLT
jgi:hypothetical protein